MAKSARRKKRTNRLSYKRRRRTIRKYGGDCTDNFDKLVNQSEIYCLISFKNIEMKYVDETSLEYIKLGKLGEPLLKEEYDTQQYLNYLYSTYDGLYYALNSPTSNSSPSPSHSPSHSPSRSPSHSPSHTYRILGRFLKEKKTDSSTIYEFDNDKLHDFKNDDLYQCGIKVKVYSYMKEKTRTGYHVWEYISNTQYLYLECNSKSQLARN